jgi:hypothetical protein
MIDAGCEALLRLSEAAKVINPSRPPHVASVWRWALAGVRGQKLETVVIGGQRWTSREAIARFVQRLNEPGAVPDPPNQPAEDAGAELVRRGC